MPKHLARISCWEPTPSTILDEVLHFTQIKQEDVLFDLGSGDGVVLTRAAELYGCRAVGLEITPHLIKATRKRAKQIGVKKLVTVRNQDMRKANYERASIVYMYLPDGAVNKMFPILKKYCRQGTKIVTLGSNHVSGNFKSVKPYKMLQINLPDRFWKMRMWLV